MKSLVLFIAILWCSTAMAQPPLEGKVKVTKGIASIYRIDVPVRDIITGDPSVADVSPLTDQSILIEGKRIGTTNLIFLDNNKQQLSEVLVVVGEQGTGFTRIHNKAKLNSFTSFNCWQEGCEFVGENTVAEPAPLPAGNLSTNQHEYEQMKKRKRRSVAASRAASLKGWRTRKRMRKHYIYIPAEFWNAPHVESVGHRTIDLLPKVEWNQ